MSSRLLEVKNLRTNFYTQDGIVKAVRGISFVLEFGEILAFVGESGCGKSVSMLSLIRLIDEPPGKIESGEATFEGRDLLKFNQNDLRKIRGRKISMIFQDPLTSLNPVLSIGTQMTESLQLHKGLSSKAAQQQAINLLNIVGIPNPNKKLKIFPHQFSGGMRQRVMIAMALSCDPQLLIADEPTTALDVTIQAQIIALVKRLQKQMGLSVIWITHDLGVVARIAQRVIVMYAGLIVEQADTKSLFANPRHPYTIGLLGSLPRLDEPEGTKLQSIQGQPPDLCDLHEGCAFAERCWAVKDRCWKEEPQLEGVNNGHLVACWEKNSQEVIRSYVRR
jgi:oligopeptide transport system ATP-binding protein